MKAFRSMRPASYLLLSAAFLFGQVKFDTLPTTKYPETLLQKEYKNHNHQDQKEESWQKTRTRWVTQSAFVFYTVLKLKSKISRQS
jgi:hypothetical protein